MDRKTFTILFAVILIGSFFLPYINFAGIGSASGYEIVTSKSESREFSDLVIKYIWLLIPISSIMLLLGAINNDNYIIARGLWSWLPLLTLIYIVFRLYLYAKNRGGRTVSINDLSDIFGPGFWLAFIAAMILAFYTPRSS